MSEMKLNPNAGAFIPPQQSSSVPPSIPTSSPSGHSLFGASSIAVGTPLAQGRSGALPQQTLDAAQVFQTLLPQHPQYPLVNGIFSIPRVAGDSDFSAPGKKGRLKGGLTAPPFDPTAGP